MWVHEIWRYPVKSMAGESLDRADLTAQGVAGDRTLQVRSSDGQIVTARTRPALLGYRATSGPDGERQWEGGALRIGETVIGIEDLRTRCIMTTYDPDTLKQHLNVLRRVQKEFAGRLGLNCHVAAPGHIRVGDSVEFVPPR
jgi:MOSC domain-containing protein